MAPEAKIAMGVSYSSNPRSSSAQSNMTSALEKELERGERGASHKVRAGHDTEGRADTSKEVLFG